MSMENLHKLKEDRAGHAVEMKKLLDSCDAENRGFNDDEQSRWDDFKNKIEQIDKRIADFEAYLQVCRQNADAADAADTEGARRHAADRRSHSYRDSKDPSRPIEMVERNCALRYWLMYPTGESYDGEEFDREAYKRLKGGFDGLSKKSWRMRWDRGRSESGELFQAPKTHEEVQRQAIVRANTPPEKRATQVIGTANLGGDLVPDEIMRPIEDALLFFGGMRQVATIISTATGADMPIPTANDTTQTGEWLAEDNAAAEQAVTFGQIVMSAWKASSKLVPVSIELMQDSATSMAAFLGQKLGERIGRLQNTGFTTGDNASKPNGIVTASPTAAATTASNTAITYEEMMTLEHGVDIAYRNMGASWMMHDTVARYLKEIADSQNRPLWLPSIAAGAPDTFLGYPYVINNDMPTGSNVKFVIFGALSKYLIREVLDFSVIRLDERYAEFGRVAFLGFSRVDGDLLDAGVDPVQHLLSAT